MKWTADELIKLKELVDKNKDYDDIAKELGRTTSSIKDKMYSIGLHKKGHGSVWTEEDIKQFKDDWLNNKYTVTYIAKKYGRSVEQISHKAWELGFGSREAAHVDISITELAKELEIDRNKLVRWISNHGLKVIRNRAGLQKYLVNLKDLLKWMEKNQDKFDASKISDTLFLKEPDWLIEKRKRDLIEAPNKKHKIWTEAEISKLKLLLDMGKTPEFIAKQLGRTKISVQRKMLEYDISKHRQYNISWTIQEIKILTENYNKVSYEELIKLLPKRNKNAILSKIGRLKRLGLL